MSPSLSLKPPKETEIVSAILSYLKVVPGVTAWRNNTGAFAGEYKGRKRFVRFGFPGISDIIGWVDNCAYPRRLRSIHALEGPSGAACHPTANYHVPRFLAIEVKRPGGRPTVEQQAFLDSVNQAGGLGFVATSVQDVANALQTGGR